MIDAYEQAEKMRRSPWWPHVPDEGFMRIRAAQPNDGSCVCEVKWRMNLYMMQTRQMEPKVGWDCPVHGLCIPDERGRPIPRDKVLAKAEQRRQERLEEQRKRRSQDRQRITDYRQHVLGIDA